ncbi:hypothetical protein KM043_007411 [Ampulex compressa]|nr:hypothetical protein KM043_007411 [Ampulex compressa]
MREKRNSRAYAAVDVGGRHREPSSSSLGRTILVRSQSRSCSFQLLDKSELRQWHCASSEAKGRGSEESRMSGPFGPASSLEERNGLEEERAWWANALKTRPIEGF